jgi:hypothetical protein
LLSPSPLPLRDCVQDFAKSLKEAPKGKGLLVLTSCSVGECSYEEEERTALAEYTRKHGLANACRLLFNINELVFAD